VWKDGCGIAPDLVGAWLTVRPELFWLDEQEGRIDSNANASGLRIFVFMGRPFTGYKMFLGT
jgi:hypothetical protein